MFFRRTGFPGTRQRLVSDMLRFGLIVIDALRLRMTRVLRSRVRSMQRRQVAMVASFLLSPFSCTEEARLRYACGILLQS